MKKQSISKYSAYHSFKYIIERDLDVNSEYMKVFLNFYY